MYSREPLNSMWLSLSCNMARVIFNPGHWLRKASPWSQATSLESQLAAQSKNSKVRPHFPQVCDLDWTQHGLQACAGSGPQRTSQMLLKVVSVRSSAKWRTSTSRLLCFRCWKEEKPALECCVQIHLYRGKCQCLSCSLWEQLSLLPAAYLGLAQPL